MPKQPLIVYVAAIGAVFVVLAAAVGADSEAVGNVFINIMIWMFPGAFLGAIAFAFASAVSRDVMVPLGVGVSVTALAWIFRGMLWIATF